MTDARTIIAKAMAAHEFGEGFWDRLHQDWRDATYTKTDAIIAALSAQGLVIVPREPTRPMVDAVEDWAGEQVHNRFKAWWRAAIAAATPPGEAG